MNYRKCIIIIIIFAISILFSIVYMHSHRKVVVPTGVGIYLYKENTYAETGKTVKQIDIDEQVGITESTPNYEVYKIKNIDEKYKVAIKINDKYLELEIR